MNWAGKPFKHVISNGLERVSCLAVSGLTGVALLLDNGMAAEVRVVPSARAGHYEVQIPSAPDAYYILTSGAELGSVKQPLSLIDGREAAAEGHRFSFSPSSNQAFYEVRRYAVSQPGDFDHDGIDDLFEYDSPFLNPFDLRDGAEDHDADGLSNFEEYFRGTDLTERDVYPLRSLSDRLIVGKVGASLPIEAVLEQWGLGKQGVPFELTQIGVNNDVSSVGLISDGAGRLNHSVIVEPGTMKVRLGGYYAANEVEFIVSSSRLVAVGADEQRYFAGADTILSARLEGWDDAGLREGLQLHMNAESESGSQEAVLSVDAQGKVEFPFTVPAGTSTVEVTSPELEGQVVSFRIEGVTQEADTLRFLDPFDPSDPWLSYGKETEFEVVATGPGGAPLPGVSVDWVVSEGRADVEQKRLFTDALGRMRVQVTPESAGVIQLRARNGSVASESEFAVTPITYEDDVQAIFQKCATCHHADFPLPLLTFEQIRYGIGPRSRKPIVDPKDPDNSPIVYLTRPEEGEMFLNTQCCTTTPPLTAGEAVLIREWVASGGQEAFLRPGQPDSILPSGGLDQVGVLGTQLPRPLRFKVVDSLGLGVPLVEIHVRSSRSGDALGEGVWKSNYSGEIQVPFQLALEPDDRRISVEIRGHDIAREFELRINDSYQGGVLGSSEHSLDTVLSRVLKSSNLEPVERSTQGEFLMRVVEHTTGRHPDIDDPEIGSAVREFLGVGDTTASRRRLIDQLVDSEAFLKHWVADRISSWIEVPEKADPRDGEPRFDVPAIELLEDDDSLTQFVKTIGTLGGYGFRWRNAGFHEAGYAISSTHDVMEGGKNSFEQVMGAFAATSIGCARCHDHKLTGSRDNPRWTQEQAYDMYAFFAESPTALEMPQVDGSLKASEINFPVWWLDGDEKAEVSLNSVADAGIGPVISLVARRTEFWNRLTSSPVFSRAVSHRIWSELFSPLVDPRDIRGETLEPLRQSGMIHVLNQLQSAFEEQGAGLKEFVRYCLYSEAYQLTSRTHDGYDKAADAMLGRFPVGRRYAETLNHGFHIAAGVEFESHSYLPLRILGYPNRRVVPHWDHRRHTAGVTEALMMLNSRYSAGWLANSSDSVISVDYANRLDAVSGIERSRVFNELAEELVFKVLLRNPTASEKQYLETLPATPSSLRDLAAGLGSSSEFVFR